ncbi:MAG: hypothetical protein ACR2O1_10555, partial [Boseongicola sp.]
DNPAYKLEALLLIIGAGRSKRQVCDSRQTIARNHHKSDLYSKKPSNRLTFAAVNECFCSQIFFAGTISMVFFQTTICLLALLMLAA